MRLGIHRWALVAMLTIAMLALAYANHALAIQPTDVGYVCEQGPMVAEGIFWTPVILLNSPYAGYATATQSLTYTATYTFTSGPITLTSQVSTQVSQTISASNGEAVGLFRLDEWAIYSTKTVPILNHPSEPCTQPYVAQDLGPALVSLKNYPPGPYYQPIQILPPGTTSDENEPNQVYYTLPNGTGYYSVIFNNGFSNNGVKYLSTCGYSAYSPIYVSQTKLLTTSVSISINGYSASGTVTISTTTTNAWTYYLAPGYVYVISYAGGQGPAYAFAVVQPCSG